VPTIQRRRSKTLKKLIVAALLAMTLLALCGCAASSSSTESRYPGFGTPNATLDTFFTSRMKKDFETTWQAYYKHYSDKVTKAEFLQHSNEDPSVLTAYAIKSLDQSSDTSATAQVSLTFKSSVATQSARQVDVTEQLVNESGKWRIAVW
jgi:hypothetical protein